MPEQGVWGYPHIPEPDPPKRAYWKCVLLWLGIRHWRGKKIT